MLRVIQDNKAGRAGRRKFYINIRATNPEKGGSRAQEYLVDIWMDYIWS